MYQSNTGRVRFTSKLLRKLFSSVMCAPNPTLFICLIIHSISFPSLKTCFCFYIIRNSNHQFELRLIQARKPSEIGQGLIVELHTTWTVHHPLLVFASDSRLFPIACVGVGGQSGETLLDGENYISSGVNGRELICDALSLCAKAKLVLLEERLVHSLLLSTAGRTEKVGELLFDFSLKSEGKSKLTYLVSYLLLFFCFYSTINVHPTGRRILSDKKVVLCGT